MPLQFQPKVEKYQLLPHIQYDLNFSCFGCSMDTSNLISISLSEKVIIALIYPLPIFGIPMVARSLGWKAEHKLCDDPRLPSLIWSSPSHL